MALTSAEKAAGRVFRDGEHRKLAALAALSPAAPCPAFIREYRHACPRNGGVSTAIRMREHYELSPEGLFAFIWLSGGCACGLAVRSSGRLVLAAARPPERRSSGG